MERKGIANNACELVGNTPMVYINKVASGCGARIGNKL